MAHIKTLEENYNKALKLVSNFNKKVRRYRKWSFFFDSLEFPKLKNNREIHRCNDKICLYYSNASCDEIKYSLINSYDSKRVLRRNRFVDLTEIVEFLDSYFQSCLAKFHHGNFESSEIKLFIKYDSEDTENFHLLASELESFEYAFNKKIGSLFNKYRISDYREYRDKRYYCSC